MNFARDDRILRGRLRESRASVGAGPGGIRLNGDIGAGNDGERGRSREGSREAARLTEVRDIDGILLRNETRPPGRVDGKRSGLAPHGRRAGPRGQGCGNLLW